MIRVLVADDHAAVRAGVLLILGGAPDIEVVGEAADGRAAVELAMEMRPDVVLMDIRMPRLDGIAATAELNGVADVIVLTTFDQDEYVFGALRAGAAGFLLKNIDADTLVQAVRLVARGDGLISPSVTRQLISAFAQTRTAPEPEGLTAREREVLGCLGRGCRTRR
ncbi:DNA-binding response regulator [Acrocarpospora corrugata]|uniref:DNA-binding response regulator n=1 Tax=Acrocarpospora corrugata TaxID=35763 RepID=A0A5M3W8Q1_9ACTN|nr:DNA-binding response regulator [Acrocarpospora corrugata]